MIHPALQEAILQDVPAIGEGLLFNHDRDYDLLEVCRDLTAAEIVNEVWWHYRVRWADDPEGFWQPASVTLGTLDSVFGRFVYFGDCEDAVILWAQAIRWLFTTLELPVPQMWMDFCQDRKLRRMHVYLRVRVPRIDELDKTVDLCLDQQSFYICTLSQHMKTPRYGKKRWPIDLAEYWPAPKANEGVSYGVEPDPSPGSPVVRQDIETRTTRDSEGNLVRVPVRRSDGASVQIAETVAPFDPNMSGIPV